MALRSRRPWTTLLFGLLLGFVASSWLFVSQIKDGRRRTSDLCLSRGVPAEGPDVLADPPEDRFLSAANSSSGLNRRFLYVGVMTAKKYLLSRATAARNTWAASIPGRVEFFSSAGSGRVHVPVHLPVVSLDGVDDSYPPQKKSFMMLKYMHEHHLHEYEWFMRADDDVYIRGDHHGNHQHFKV